MRKLLKVFKDKIYCTQGSYAFLVLFLYCACLAFYYTSLFLFIFFLYSISSNWNGYQIQHKHHRQHRVVGISGISVSSCLSTSYFNLEQSSECHWEACLLQCSSSWAPAVPWSLPRLEHSFRSLSHSSTAAQPICPGLIQNWEVCCERGCWARAGLSVP